MTSRRRGLTVLELLIIIIVIVVGVVLLLRWRGAKDSPTAPVNVEAAGDSVASGTVPAAGSALTTDLAFLAPTDSVAATGDTVTVRLRATTAAGAAVAQATIHVSVASGGGRLLTESGVTDGSGEMEVRWMLGSEPGPQSLRATVEGNANPAATLTITARADAGGSA